MLLSRDAAAFLLVGGVAALAYVGINSLVMALDTGIADWVVSAVIYAVFVPLVYLAHRALSFRSTAPHGRAFARYVTVQLMAVGVASGLSFVTFELLDVGPVLGSAAVVGITSLFSYLMLRGWAFAHGGDAS